MSRSCKVAVRGLLREGHEVVVFEKSDRVGGTWVYDPNRDAVHGSFYSSLQTNLPVAGAQGLIGLPLNGSELRGLDDVPGPGKVLAFLEVLARDAGVMGAVRLGTEVMRVTRGGSGGWMWMACNVAAGHQTEPRFRRFLGLINGLESKCTSTIITLRRRNYFKMRTTHLSLFMPVRYLSDDRLAVQVGSTSEEDMMASVTELYHHMEESGKPKCYTRSLLLNQVEYLNRLAAEIGLPAIEEWRFHMYDTAVKSICSHYDGY